MKGKDKDRAIKEFQNNPDIKIFVGNMKAAGVGLTLTKASTVLFVEMGDTPGLHTQAEDRAHRISQENKVVVWYMIGKNTIDEKMFEVIKKKQTLLKKAVGGEDIEIEETENMLNTVLGELKK